MYVHLRFYNIIDKNYLINKLNMKSSEKFLKILSGILENSFLNSQDTKNEIKNSLKFQRDKLLNSLKIVSGIIDDSLASISGIVLRSKVEEVLDI